MAPPKNDHHTYLKLCEDPNLNLVKDEDISKYYEAWKTDDPALGSTDLLNEILLDMGGEKFVGAIAVFVAKTGVEGGLLEVLHSPCKHSARDDHRGKIFVYHGDVDGHDINLLEFDRSLLDLTNYIVVAESVTYQGEIFAVSASLEAAPAFAAGAARTKRIRPRNSMFLPYPLIPYVIDKGLSAKAAYDVLVPVIESLGLMAPCKPLLDFLLVATTKPDAAPHTALTIQKSLGAPPSNAKAVQHSRR